MNPHATSHQPGSAEAPPGRRNFLQWITYLLGAVAGALVGLPFIGFLLKTPKPPVDWIPLGKWDEFPVDETRMCTFKNKKLGQPWDGDTANTGVFVRRNDGKDKDAKDLFLILAVNCAHLGCPVSWFPQSGLFMCPCHGGVYYANGEHASGPPPRGLFRCVWRINDGKLELRAPHYPTLDDTLEEPA